MTARKIAIGSDKALIDSSRRSLLQLAGAGLAASALGATRLAHGQVPEESNTEALALMRKGIDRELQVINIDLLEAEARKVYSDAVYAFVVNGSGKNWTLRENQRAWGDWSLNPQSALRRHAGVAFPTTSGTSQAAFRMRRRPSCPSRQMRA